jgi:hypothetical protein
VHSSSPPYVLHSLFSTCSLTYHSNYTWWRVQIMKLLIMRYSPPSCHFIPLFYGWICSETLIPGVKFSGTKKTCVLSTYWCQELQ